MTRSAHAPLSNIAPSSPAARTKLLLNGPILPTLLRLAAPNILNFLAFVGVIIFDGFFLGRIGTSALAGASLAFPFVMLVLQTTNSGMGAGVTSAIARALGAGKRDRADELVFHAFLLALGAWCDLLDADAACRAHHLPIDGRARRNVGGRARLPTSRSAAPSPSPSLISSAMPSRHGRTWVCTRAC